MRILLLDNLMIRRYGNLRMGPGRKLMCGAIRGNHRLCEFSDRDLARFLTPLGIRKIGGRIMNRKLIKTAQNFQPDIILIGHCDFVTNDTLRTIRAFLPAVKIGHFNVDPIWQEHTQLQIRQRMDTCDSIFITTAGDGLRQFCTGHNVVAYMPNPSDPSMESQDNSLKTTFDYDLFFAGNEREGDPRVPFLHKLKDLLAGKLNFQTFGMFGTPSIWGAAYERVLAGSKMSLNLNRKEGDLWYSSDRIAHLMGYGILTFLSDAGRMQDFFSPEQAVFFHNETDLAEKIIYYMQHDDERARIAGAGRKRYHELFNGERVLRFMIETLCGQPYSEAYEWGDEVYR